MSGTGVFGLEVVFDDLPKLYDEFEERAARLTAKAALDCEGLAKGNIQANGTIDTGAMLNGVYAVTQRYNGWAAASGAVASRRPGHVVPGEALLATQTDAACGSAADYSAVIEFGGAHRAAHPFMLPAFDKACDGLERAMDRLFLEGIGR